MKTANQAAIYVRVSSQDQVDNYSLSTQEKRCRDYCAENSWPVAQVFREEGESAKTANRTQLQKLLRFCAEQKGRVSYVVVYDVSRFSRASADYHALCALLQRSNISLRSATQTLGDSPEGEFMGSILAALAALENNVKAKRTKEGMKAAIAAGKWTHKAPLGYVNTPSQGLIHDPIRAPLIKSAFERMASGAYSQKEVLVQITAAGLLQLSGKAMSLQSFNKMLRKPVYCGRIVVRNLGQNMKADFEPVVPPNMFDDVQAIIAGKRKRLGARQQLNPDFPLRVFARCGHCDDKLTGSMATGRGGKKYGHYWCRNSACRQVKVTKGTLESAFVTTLTAISPTPAAMRLLEAVVIEVWKQQGDANLVRGIAAKQRIEDLDEKRERVETAFIFEKTIDAETYDRQLTKLREQRMLAQIEQNEAAAEGYQIEAVLEFAKHVLTNAAEMWLKATPELRVKLQQLIFPKGVTFKDGSFGTAPTSVLFNILHTAEEDSETLASPRGFEPRFSP